MLSAVSIPSCAALITLATNLTPPLALWSPQLSIAYPAAGTQKLIEVDDDAKLCASHASPEKGGRGRGAGSVTRPAARCAAGLEHSIAAAASVLLRWWLRLTPGHAAHARQARFLRQAHRAGGGRRSAR
jgi:hypothetical protein